MPDSNFGASLPLDSLVTYAQVDGFVLVRDLANPTGADPPVPPPEYCVVSIAAD